MRERRGKRQSSWSKTLKALLGRTRERRSLGKKRNCEKSTAAINGDENKGELQSAHKIREKSCVPPLLIDTYCVYYSTRLNHQRSYKSGIKKRREGVQK